jgi:Cid1 family poly A polymerase
LHSAHGALLRRFDFMTDVVCVARGQVAPKTDLGWTSKTNHSEYHLVSIQDPFLLKHDLGRTVGREARDTLQREFRRAADIMYTSADPLRELFKPYRALDGAARKPAAAKRGGGAAGGTARGRGAAATGSTGLRGRSGGAGDRRGGARGGRGGGDSADVVAGGAGRS